jgi:putative transposase
MMADITTVRGLFGLQEFKVGAVLDVFSRLPLAAQVFLKEPSAEQMLALLWSAISRHEPPRHFVSDQGAQFTATAFREALARHGIRQRFGAIGRTGSIAIIERFWRTLKDATRVRLLKPLRQEDLEHRLQSALLHYSAFRPHTALGGATPIEAFCGLPPAHLTAVRPPRGRPGEGKAECPFVIEFLDDERRFPIVTRAA